MAKTANDIAQAPPVVRLIRCRETYRYFTGNGWSDDPDRAEIYVEQIDAVRACVFHKLENIELVLRLHGSQTDLFCTMVR